MKNFKSRRRIYIILLVIGVIVLCVDVAIYRHNHHVPKVNDACSSAAELSKACADRLNQ